MAIPDKRDVDQRILGEWIREGSRVLDLGCGRGVLLEYLQRSRQARGLGVDIDSDKIRACVKRGVDAYQGDMLGFMKEFPDRHFDYVICSRTVQELPSPADFLGEALRVGSRVAIGFVNFGYWRNRVHLAWHGSRLVNEVHPHPWEEGRLQNPVTLRDFERYLSRTGANVTRRVVMRGDWTTECTLLPNLLGGYALFELTRQPGG